MYKKVILALLIFFSTMLNVYAEESYDYLYTFDEIPNGTYIIGNYMFTREVNDLYSGALTTEDIMLAAKTISGSFDKKHCIIYYKNIRGKWYNAITGKELNILDNYFEIDNLSYNFSVLFKNNKFDERLLEHIPTIDAMDIYEDSNYFEVLTNTKLNDAATHYELKLDNYYSNLKEIILDMKGTKFNISGYSGKLKVDYYFDKALSNLPDDFVSVYNGKTISLTPAIEVCFLEKCYTGNKGEKISLYGEKSSLDNNLDTFSQKIALNSWLFRSASGACEKDEMTNNDLRSKCWSDNNVQKISVPIRMDKYYQYNWFSTTFNTEGLDLNSNLLLEFNGMPYYTEYYINGYAIGKHIGRYDKFYIEIPKKYIINGENFITVYCENPNESNGIVYKNKNLTYDNIPITYDAYPRIQEKVYLNIRPDVYLEDYRIEPDCKNGTCSGLVKIAVTVYNTTNSKQNIILNTSIKDKNGILNTKYNAIEVNSGRSSQNLEIMLDSFEYWSPENPNLYQILLYLKNKDGRTDVVTQNTAFRVLEVDNEGYFKLNNNRYFLKGVFGSENNPLSFYTDENPDVYYKLITNLKANGFNLIRFLDTVPTQDFLEMCDQVGMMVYTEHPMAWHKKDFQDDLAITEELFKNSVISTIKTIRNHPSVIMLGFLNETKVDDEYSKIYEMTLSWPSWARKYFNTGLFVLSSGRFDENLHYGSISNPYSTTWNGYLGNEDVNKPDKISYNRQEHSFASGIGDVHYYPLLPLNKAVLDKIKTIEHYDRAVFMTESGVGSLLNYYSILANRNIYNKDMGNAYIDMDKLYTKYYNDFKLNKVFNSKEELFTESEKLSALQKARLLDYIRSNVKINGYIMTGLIDAQSFGEGIFSPYSQYKKQYNEILSSGLADLKFTINTDSKVYYTGDKMYLDVRLSDSKLLLHRNKNYDVSINIRDNRTGNIIWSKTITIRPNSTFVTVIYDDYIKDSSGKYLLLPSDGEFSINAQFVLKTDSSGNYNGNYGYAIASDNTETITVFPKQINNSLLNGKTVYQNGLSDSKHTTPSHKLAYLESLGATMKIFSLDTDSKLNINKGDVILINTNGKLSNNKINELVTYAKAGAHVIFINPISFADKNSGDFVIGDSIKGKIEKSDDWLYHAEHVVYDNQITSGLENNQLMDPLYYEKVYSHSSMYIDYRFTDNTNKTSVTQTNSIPDDVSIGTIQDAGANNIKKVDTFKAGYQLGTFVVGKGRITLSTLELDKFDYGNPIVDKIIINLISYDY